MATIGQVLATPESGWIRYDNKDNNITFENDFLESNSSSTHYNNTLHYSDSPLATIKFNFTGDRIRIISFVFTSYSDNIKITIDNVEEIYSSALSNTSNAGKYLVYEKTGLSYGEHSVVIRNGSKRIGLDAIDLSDTGVLLPYKNLPINKTLILHDGEYKKWNEKVDSTILGEAELIPAMTSNTSPKGIVEDSHPYFEEGFEAYKALDKLEYITNTSNSYWYMPTKTGWISYEFTEEVSVGAMSFRGVVTATKRNPKRWGLSVYDYNKGTWKEIANGTGQENTDVQKFYFNEVKGRKFKLDIYEIFATGTGTGDMISLDSWQLYSINKTESSPAEWSTVSSTLPTQEKFLAEGMDSLSPLLDRRVEVLEPLPMTDKSEILQGEVGKVFSKTIDLKKYLDIRNIEVKLVR